MNRGNARLSAVIPAGMFGDRAAVIFVTPEEINTRRDADRRTVRFDGRSWCVFQFTVVEGWVDRRIESDEQWPDRKTRGLEGQAQKSCSARA
jgi:hypothetical protein